MGGRAISAGVRYAYAMTHAAPYAVLRVDRRKAKAMGAIAAASDLFDRQRLRDLQSSYAGAMDPLGIRRGEEGSDAVHTEVAQFYGAVRAAKAVPVERPKPAPPPAKPPEIASMLGRIKEDAAAACGIETKHRKEVRAYQAALQRWRCTAKVVREQEASAWQRLQAAAAAVPLNRKRAPKQEQSPSRPVAPSKQPRQQSRCPAP